MQLKKWPNTPREYYQSISELNLFVNSVQHVAEDICGELAADLDDALRLQAKLIEEVSQKFELYTQPEFDEWYERQRTIAELGNICSKCPFCLRIQEDGKPYCSICGTVQSSSPILCAVLVGGQVSQRELLKKMAREYSVDVMLDWIEHKDVLSKGKSLLD